MNIRLAMLALSLALAATPSPQDPTPQQQEAATRFAAAMKATGLVHEPTSSGKSYMLQYDHSGAIRRVFVSVRPDQVADLRVHVIYTDVWTGTAAPDATRMRIAFAPTRKLGSAYLVHDAKGNWAIRFGVRFDATDLPEKPGADDTLVKRLADSIDFVDTVGDELQKTLAK